MALSWCEFTCLQLNSRLFRKSAILTSLWVRRGLNFCPSNEKFYTVLQVWEWPNALHVLWVAFSAMLGNSWGFTDEKMEREMGQRGAHTCTYASYIT